MSIPTSNATFAKADAHPGAWIFADPTARYVVPDYQRHFVWRTGQVTRFIRAILPEPDWHATPDVKDVPARFLGCLVFWSEGNRRNVIDGQQRLTTLTLAFAVVVKMLKEEREFSASSTAAGALFVAGALDPDDRELRLKSQQEEAPALEAYVRDSLADGDDVQESVIGKAYASIREEFERAIESASPAATGELRIKLIKRIYHRLMYGTEFVVLLAQNEVDAFSLFDSLNTPGVPLDTGDRLKNKLLSLSDRGGRDDVYAQVKEQWRKLEDTLTPERPSDFLHAYWRAFHTYVPEKLLYEEIVNHLDGIDTPRKVLQFLKALVDSAKLYAKSYSAVAQRSLHKQQRLSYKLQSDIKARTARPLLLWVETHRKSDILETLRITETIAARQIYSGLSAQQFNKAYEKCIESLRANPRQSIPDLLIEQFDSKMPSDREFAAAIKSLACLNVTPKVQWLLRRYNDSLGTSEFDLSTTTVHVEHILAVRATKAARAEAKATGLSKGNFDILVGSVGNVTLLLDEINYEVRNHPVSSKLTSYKECDLKITKQLLGSPYKPFTIDSIKARGNTIAKAAVKFWAWPPR